MREAFAKSKYTVGDAVPTEDGGYDVTVTIEPLKLYAGAQTKLAERITRDDIENSKVTEKVYNSFKEHKTILSKDRQTGLDIWVSYIAFIFGLEFKGSYELIDNNDYLNKLFNRFEYKVDNSTMEELKKCAFDYLNNKLNQ